MNFTRVLQDIRDVDAEEAQQVMSVEDLCEQIRRQPDRHSTAVALIKAVRGYVAESQASTGEVVELLSQAADACDGCYVVTREEREAA